MLRLEEYKQKSIEMDEKERALCRHTNKLIDQLVDCSDGTPFQKALIQILGNMKGKFNTQTSS